MELQVDVMEAGYYQIDLNYAGNGRMVWRVTTEEDNMVQNEQNSSPIYKFHQMGLLKFEQPGKYTLRVSFVEGEIETTSLKEIRLSRWE